ncbi:UNVERIFIED_CONTAM: hypothetical protein GTU68_008996 [Idotea baltica]|nr:hypothetical protein [Idotea baltica]
MHSFYSEDTEHYFWPIIFALTLHILLFAALFISFSSHINFPQPKPLVQVKLYQLKSQSQASTVTDQKVAGAAKKTAAKQYEAEQLELKKNQQNKINIEKKKADELKKKLAADSEAKKKAVAKAKELAAAKKIADIKKKAEQKKVAEEAKRKAEEEKKKKAEEAKRKAEEEKKKKAQAGEDNKAPPTKSHGAESLAFDVFKEKQTAADTGVIKVCW